MTHMAWLWFAFSGPVLWAVSTHIDKYLVERYFKGSSVATLLVFTSIISAGMLPFIAAFEPAVLHPGVRGMLLIMLSGLLYMGAMHFYLAALKNEEASIVVPYFQITPLFGALLAYLFLGQILTHRQMGGGVLVVLGAILLAIRPGRHRRHFRLRLLLLMFACALTIAASSVIFAAFAIRTEFWITAFWSYTGEAVYGLALLAFRRIRRQFAGLIVANATSMLSINAVNELLNLGGGLGTRYALLLAPLGLVQAVGSTGPLFVFLFGAALTLLLPKFGRENLALANLFQKGLAATLVITGVTLISI